MYILINDRSFIWYGYDVQILSTRCHLNYSKLAFILSPKNSCEIHVYKNCDKNRTKENYMKIFCLPLLHSNNVIIVQSLMVIGFV